MYICEVCEAKFVTWANSKLVSDYLSVWMVFDKFTFESRNYVKEKFNY